MLDPILATPSRMPQTPYQPDCWDKGWGKGSGWVGVSVRVSVRLRVRSRVTRCGGSFIRSGRVRDPGSLTRYPSFTTEGFEVGTRKRALVLGFRFS